MSDFDKTSLHEELEIRVIALLTGELQESEADELEKILAIDPKLSAFRDQMAELMGELHQGRDEIASTDAETPRQLSEERRAKIFGDVSVLEHKLRRKRPRVNAALWGMAASIAMIFTISLLGTIKFVSSIHRKETFFEAMPIAPAPQKEPEYTVNMRQRNQSTPQPRPPAIAVANPSELEIPALEIDANLDESDVYDRYVDKNSTYLNASNAIEGSLVGAVSGRRLDDPKGRRYATRERVPLDITKELMEETSSSIRVPNPESASSEIARMIVSKDASNLPRKRDARQNKKLGDTESLLFEESDRSYGNATVNGGISAAGKYNGAPLVDAQAHRSEAKQKAAQSANKPGDQRLAIRKSEVAKLAEKEEVLVSGGFLKKDGVTLDGSKLALNYNFGDNIVGSDFTRIPSARQKTAVELVTESRAAKVLQTPKPEKLAAEEPFSTFSLNVSDVSFKLAQAALQNSRVPPAAQIRTEEFVNSFDYGDPTPRSDEPVSLNWEIAQHPFEHDRQVLRFSVQTQASGRESGQPLNLSLLVDNSGSMQRADRQAILQDSLQTLEQKLKPEDKLSIILFARQPRLIAEANSRASQKAAVEAALAYRPEGGTNIEAGLKAAYESAKRNYLPTGSNRVILLTDGAANLGNINAGELAEYVVDQRKQGIALDAYGIGWDDYNDALLEEITRNGDGRYAFLNSVEDASEDFSEKLAGTLRVAAANVKVQVEWNPDRVKRYRQIGYDLHQLKKEDFRDNMVDAAEIAEAESGTALYVLQIDDDPEIIGGLGTLRVRYQNPSSGLYKELSWPLAMPRSVQSDQSVSPAMRLAMSSALFGERLANSPFASGYDLRDLYTMTSGLPEAFPNQPRVSEMQTMMLQASELYGEK